MLNESISEFIDQGIQSLTASDITWGIKLFAIFGVIWLFGTVLKSGISVLTASAYVYGFFKWIYKKIRKEDV